jgi:opacity protein-like surface antigen
MKSALKKSTVAIIILSNAFIANAQIDLSKYELGLSGGVLVYQGDLSPEKIGAYKTLKPQFGLQVFRIVSPSLSLRLNFTRGKLYGNDAVYNNPDWRKQRNFNFTSPVTEFSVQGVWNIMSSRNSRLSPYIFGGAGLSFLKIKRDWSNMNVAVFGDGSNVQTGLAIDAATNSPRVIPVIPVGAGVRYSLTDRFSLTAETNYRLSFTDYLDGFSQAADPKKNDHYFSHSIGLIYSFSGSGGKNKGLGCPRVN